MNEQTYTLVGGTNAGLKLLVPDGINKIHLPKRRYPYTDIEHVPISARTPVGIEVYEKLKLSTNPTHEHIYIFIAEGMSQHTALEELLKEYSP